MQNPIRQKINDAWDQQIRHHYLPGMGYERINGVPTGKTIPAAFAKRFGQSLSAFLGSVFGSTPIAERSTTMVRNMHRRVHGVRPDGLSYDTREAEFFRWNYATVVWGWAQADEIYHPHPLRGADLPELADSYRRAQATPTSVSGLDQVEIAETASQRSAGASQHQRNGDVGHGFQGT